MTHKETQHTINHKTKSENQVSDFLHSFLKMLSDPNDAKKLTHMLTRCMGEEETIVANSSLLRERDVHWVSRHKCMGREFKMINELKSYGMIVGEVFTPMTHI
jgi:hypothetical protein